jgi:hypothetical protein
MDPLGDVLKRLGLHVYPDVELVGVGAGAPVVIATVVRPDVYDHSPFGRGAMRSSNSCQRRSGISRADVPGGNSSSPLTPVSEIGPNILGCAASAARGVQRYVAACVMLTIQEIPNRSTHMPKTSPHICFSNGIVTEPVAESFSQ